MVFTNPVAATLSGWLAAMTIRQIGHFFFEPKGYDEVNHATHEYKEEIKVGYNLQRKVVLMSIWAFSPLVLYFDPTLFGIFSSPANDASLKVAHLAIHRRRWRHIPDCPVVLYQGRSDWAGVDDKNSDRPLSRYQTLPHGAALLAAWRVV
jgi:hypothetical protein